MTKKQMAAMNRIISREARSYVERKSPRKAGIHPSKDFFGVSDGKVAVFLKDKPDNLPFVDESVDVIADLLTAELEKGDYFLSRTDLNTDLWRKQAREYLRNYKSGRIVERPCVLVEAKNQHGEKVSGYYDPQLILDGVEAVGGKPRVYIGKRPEHRYNSLIIVPKDYDLSDPLEIAALVLPLRKD